MKNEEVKVPRLKHKVEHLKKVISYEASKEYSFAFDPPVSGSGLRENPV